MPDREFTLVTCTISHVDVLAAIHDDSFPKAWSAKEFGDLLRAPQVFGHIALDDKNEPLGFILCRAVLDECEIITLGVLPPCRRRGIATSLLLHLIENMMRQDRAKIYLEVAENNRGALNLYRRHGFSEISRRANYYAPPSGTSDDRMDALLLAKTLLKENS